jgi:hypothetical protein
MRLRSILAALLIANNALLFSVHAAVSASLLVILVPGSKPLGDSLQIILRADIIGYEDIQFVSESELEHPLRFLQFLALFFIRTFLAIGPVGIFALHGISVNIDQCG